MVARTTAKPTARAIALAQLEFLLADRRDAGAGQDRNAANVGDAPKHVVLHAALDTLGNKLRHVAETHAGSGLYAAVDVLRSVETIARGRTSCFSKYPSYQVILPPQVI